MSEAVLIVRDGLCRELAVFSPRGEGKTMGALGAMVAHAQKHHAAGYPLPVPWFGVTDTHRSHVDKTCKSLMQPMWRGCWTLTDDDHLATFALDRVPLVHLSLFGIEDKTAMNRVRAETVGVWFEEPAPAAVEDGSTGIGEDAWALAITSMRLPSHAHVALLTSNYPDEDHWTWQRFVEQRVPGTGYIRVPRGERATPEERARFAAALANRPDLARRLLEGEPGSVQLGQAVARGYRADAHVAAVAVDPVPYRELFMGWDAWFHPACVIGARLADGQRRIYAGLVGEDMGMEEFCDLRVLPWLADHAPWTLTTRGRECLRHRHDPTMATGDQSHRGRSALQAAKKAVGGAFHPGPSDWPGRKNPMLTLLNRGYAGRAMLQINPGDDTRQLRKALGGGWHYPTSASGQVRTVLPNKHAHPASDLGDALCYLACDLEPMREVDTRPGQRQALVEPDVYEATRGGLQDQARAMLREEAYT